MLRFRFTTARLMSHQTKRVCETCIALRDHNTAYVWPTINSFTCEKCYMLRSAFTRLPENRMEKRIDRSCTEVLRQRRSCYRHIQW